MDKDVKIATGKDVESKMPKGLYNVKIVKFTEVDSKILSTPYVLKQTKNGTNYLAELHLIDHEYDFKETLCYLYDDLTKEDQEKCKDSVVTILAQFSDVQYYEKPKRK